MGRNYTSQINFIEKILWSLITTPINLYIVFIFQTSHQEDSGQRTYLCWLCYVHLSLCATQHTHTRHWPAVGSMLSRCRRRCTSIEPTPGQCLMCAGYINANLHAPQGLFQCWDNFYDIVPTSKQLWPKVCIGTQCLQCTLSTQVNQIEDMCMGWHNPFKIMTRIQLKQFD